MIRQSYPPGRPNLRQQIKGAQNRAAGMHFEQMVDASCAHYEAVGVCCIRKTPEPMRPLSKPNHKGQFLACYTQQSEPDYKGTIQGGQTVVFDAKHTSADRIESRRLTDTQRNILERYHELGAISFVLVSFSFQQFYRIPWPVWRDMKQTHGRLYLKEEELHDYRVKKLGHIVYFLEDIMDWGQ